MNSRQRRSRRRVASRIESQVRSGLSQELHALKRAAKNAEDENLALRRVRTEYARGLYPSPYCFDILQPLGTMSLPRGASKTVHVEMVRYAVSIPHGRFYHDGNPPISLYREQAVHAIYEEFRKRAIVEAEEFKDERGEVYTLSIVLPVER